MRAGADLFTSNVMYATIAVYEGAGVIFFVDFLEPRLGVPGGWGWAGWAGRCALPAPPRAAQPSRPISPHAPLSTASPARLTRCATGRYGLLGLLRCWLVSYLSNLCGSLVLVGLMMGGDVFHGGRADFVVE